jgi:cytosine/adenosine deaminase-related metal-dependent hydrolase
MSPNECYALQARYLFPVDGPPIAEGMVAVQDGRIVAVGEHLSGAAPRDLGNAAILPGLINAHTHLEFSELTSPLGEAGMPFVDWIRAVVGWRRDAGDADQAAQRTQRAIRLGLAESHRAGVAQVGEIATSNFTANWSPNCFADIPIGATVFRELIGLAADRIESLLEIAEQHVAGDGVFRRGISPHAPYTVSPELVRRVARLSSQRGFPVAMHLAESSEELELLASASGPFVELLQELGAWDPSAIPRGVRPLDYLKLLAEADRALVIHGNYLARDELEFTAAHADRMAIVYCPRTHAYFGHGRYPLAEMLERGVRAALGTDSRASNPDLSLFEEMRHVARLGDVPLDRVLELGTFGGATALGIDAQCGTLTAGKRAEFTIVALPPAVGSADPHELLFDGLPSPPFP